MNNIVQSKKIKVRGLDINYLSGGQGDPVIVVHGGGDSSRAWRQNAVALSRHYKVYIPDLPGFGNSQSNDDHFSFSKFVSFLDDFSRHLGLKQFHLVGHSVGGGIALHYALKFPQRINRLVIIDSMCLGKEIATWARVMSSPLFCRFLGEAALAGYQAARWVIRLFHDTFEFANPVSRIKMGIGKNLMTLRGQTNILLNQLSELVAPTLVIWGSQDGVVPVAQAYAAADLIPDCQLHVFESCGHSAYRDRIDDFSRLLVDFLD